MSAAVERIGYTVRDPTDPLQGAMPLLNMALEARSRASVIAMLDSGAAVSILPFSVGERLGLVWEEEKLVLPMAGILSGTEARGVRASALVGAFLPAQLVFAWVKTDGSHPARADELLR